MILVKISVIMAMVPVVAWVDACFVVLWNTVEAMPVPCGECGELHARREVYTLGLN